MADKPVTREEKYLAYLTGNYTGELPKPITRKEKYLYELCLKGMGGEVSPEEIKSAVNEYLEKNPVKPGATTEQAQQIEQNKADIASLKEETSSLKEDITSKADKTALAKTDRKLDALWKLNQGISYEFQTDDTEAYQKTVPSGAKVANVKSIGGKTIVWNQLITDARKINFSVKEKQEEGWLKTTNTTCHSGTLLIKNHAYIGLLQTDCKNITVKNTAYGEVATGIFTCNNDARYNQDYDLYIVSSGVNVGEYYFSYMLFDLTQMFGSGNEPSTPEEFEAIFPADYYPHNAGELMSAPVNEVTYSDTKNQETSYPIPQAILNLPDYGWSVGDARNEVAYENKQYIQRVGKTEFNGDEQWYSWGETIDGSQALLVYVDSAKVPTNNNNNNNNILTSKYTVMEYIKVYNGDKGIGLGVYDNRPVLLIRDSNYTNVTVWKNHLKEENLTVYYELAEPIVTDISDIIDNTFQEPLEVEAGGTLTFKNSNGDNYRIPVPSSEEYLISLAEVAK